MKFSIITVCFNSEKTIKRTINSVLNQTFQDYEYIIIDGGSSDSTLSIIKDFVPKFNGKLKYISEKDNGIYDAMNKGVRLAQGSLIGILNSDDTYENNTLDIINKAYNPSTKYQVLHGIERAVNSNEQELFLRMLNVRHINADTIRHQSAFITQATYNDLGLYDTNFKYAADYELFLRLSRNEDVKFVPVYDIVDNFSCSGVSAINQVYECEKEALVIKRKYGLLSSKHYYALKLIINYKKLLKL